MSTILCHLVLTSYQQHIPQVQLLLFPQRDTAVSLEGERSMLVSPPSHPTIYNTLTIKHNWNNFWKITKPLLSKSSLFLDPSTVMDETDFLKTEFCNSILFWEVPHWGDRNKRSWCITYKLYLRHRDETQHWHPHSASQINTNTQQLTATCLH